MDTKRLKLGISCFLILMLKAAEGLDTNVEVMSPAAAQEDEDAAFKRFEDRILSLMKNIRRQALPFITRAAYDVTMTTTCSRSLTRLYNELISFKSWALKMLDSSGKVPSGLLKGNMVMLGNYDECLEIAETSRRSDKDPPILGKYCLTFLYVPQTLLIHLRQFSLGKIRNTSSTERFKELFDLMSRYKFDGTVIHLRLGVCIPSTCSEEDLSNILKYALSDSGMTAEIRSCYVKGPYYPTVDQIIILSVFGLIAATVFVATTVDCYNSITKSSSEKEGSVTKPRGSQILLNFSISRNMKKLFSDELEEETYFNIPCLRGFTVLLFCFYVVVNSYAIIDEHAIRSLGSSINYFNILKEPLFAIIANSMIYVDTLFGMAGFLLFYRTSTNKGITELSFKEGIKKGIFRYVLPVPAAIGVFLLLPVFGDGPAFHEVLNKPLSACRRNWWTNVFFFSNFLRFEEQCMLHTWYLACLAQLLIIGFVFKKIINRSSKIGLGSLAILVVGCNIYLGIAVVQEQLPPTVSMYFIFSIRAMKRITEKIYFLPHGHIGSFAIGMCTGYWLQKNPNFRITRVWKFVGRLTIISLLCCLVFGLYLYHDGSQMSSAALALYSSLHGIVLGVIASLALVISLRGDSDVVSRALSSKYFLPMRKLLYHTYLLHWTVIFLHFAVARERQHLGHYEQITRSFGHIVSSFLLAFVFYILFNGIFSLGEITSSPSGGTSQATSWFKSIVVRRKFEIRKPTVYGISNDFAMQTCKYVAE